MLRGCRLKFLALGPGHLAVTSTWLPAPSATREPAPSAPRVPRAPPGPRTWYSLQGSRTHATSMWLPAPPAGSARYTRAPRVPPAPRLGLTAAELHPRGV